MNYPTKKNARIAGLLYLLLALTGMFGILYVPTQLIVQGDVATTMENIKNQELLYRLGILSQLACQTLFVYLVLSLHKLLRDVNEHHSRQMVALVIVSVPIAFINMLNQLAALVLLSDADFLSAFQPEQLHAMVMVFFRLYELGIIVAQIFWGLWLIPFGMLVYKSGFIPRLPGILLIVGGLGYVVASVIELMVPQYSATVGFMATIPSSIGEFSVMLWLLIWGVRSKKNAEVAAVVN